MKPKIVILCGGQGRRLRPLTADVPKPLVPLYGKPILQHVIEFYIRHEFREFILCAGFRAEMIREFIEAQRFQADVMISDAGETASMLKRLHVVRELIAERAIVTYGDTFVNIDPNEIVLHHLRQQTDVTMTIADVRSPFGIVTVGSDHRVEAFTEKPVLPYYIGQFVMERRVLDELEPCLLQQLDGEGLVELFQQLIRQQQLGAFKHTGLRITFNTLSERDEAEEAMSKFFTEQSR